MHEVETSTTLIFAGILAAMILTLALEEKLHAKKSLITGVFAVISLGVGHLFHVLPFDDDGLHQVIIPNGHHINMPVYIPGIDWGVIAIIFGSSLFVDVTAKSGLFTWIAIKLTKASGGDPFRLLVAYALMTVVFSALLNNVTAMIIVGSLSAVSLNKLQKNNLLLGFLLLEGLLTNVGGLLTLISSVPNIIVGQAAGISFVEFFVVASPYVLVTSVITVMMGAKLFKIARLKTAEEKAEAVTLVASFDENDGIESKPFFFFAAVMLMAFIASIASSSVLNYPLGMGFVAIAFGVIMLIRYKSSVDKFYRALDWDLLLFFGFLFVVIYVMEHAQVLHLIGGGLEHVINLNTSADGAGTGALLVSSAAASAVTDNIPLAAMLANILGTEEMATFVAADKRLWWSVIFGANLGGNLTPIGSASTVVAVTIMHKHGLNMSFGGFVKAAFFYAVVQITLAVVYVLYVVPYLMSS